MACMHDHFCNNVKITKIELWNTLISHQHQSTMSIQQTALREEVSVLQAAVAKLSTLPRILERLAAQVQRLSTREPARSSSPGPARQISFGHATMGQHPPKPCPEGSKDHSNAFPEKKASNWDGLGGGGGGPGI